MKAFSGPNPGIDRILAAGVSAWSFFATEGGHRPNCRFKPTKFELVIDLETAGPPAPPTGT
jgi:hypothetical protein